MRHRPAFACGRTWSTMHGMYVSHLVYRYVRRPPPIRTASSHLFRHMFGEETTVTLLLGGTSDCRNHAGLTYTIAILGAMVTSVQSAGLSCGLVPFVEK
jgi:hypothetical protein